MRITLTIDCTLQTDLAHITEHELADLMLRDKHHGVGSVMTGFVGEQFTHGTQIVPDSTLIEIEP